MNCPWCQYDNAASARFCGDCGRPLQSEAACNNCGVSTPRANRFCDACGSQLGGPERSVAAPSSAQELAQRRETRPSKQAPEVQWDTPAPVWQMSGGQVRSWAVRHRWELALVALLTVVAWVLRLYRLADFPPGLHGDEAWTGLDAMRIVKEGWIGPYVGSALGQPTGPLYFTALIFKLTNASLFTVRLSMALLGVATVPLAYLLFRTGFGRWVAIFGTIALTFSFWHIHFSRTAFMVVSMPMVMSVAGIALFWTMRSARKWPWIVTGLILGLGVYTYNGYPLFLVAVLVVLSVHLVLLRSRWRLYLPRYLLLVAGFALAALPLIRFAAHSPDFYFSHARQLSALKDPRYLAADGIGEKVDFLAGRTWDAATLLARHPDIDYTDATGGRGALNVFLAALAYLGIVISVARWRSPPHLLSLLAVVAGMGVIVLGAVNWGDMRRSLVAVPFVYGLAGVGAWWLSRAGERVLGALGRRTVLAVLAAGLVSAMALNTWSYFGDFIQQDRTKWVFVNDLVDGLQAAHAFDEPGKIYFYSGRWSYDYETRRFLYPDSPGMDRSEEFGSFSLRRLDSGPVTYLLLPPYERELDRLVQTHPGGTVVREPAHGSEPRYVVYHLP